MSVVSVVSRIMCDVERRWDAGTTSVVVSDLAGGTNTMSDLGREWPNSWTSTLVMVSAGSIVNANGTCRRLVWVALELSA